MYGIVLQVDRMAYSYYLKIKKIKKLDCSKREVSVVHVGILGMVLACRKTIIRQFHTV